MKMTLLTLLASSVLTATLAAQTPSPAEPLKVAEGVVLLAQLIEHPRTADVIRGLGGTK